MLYGPVGMLRSVRVDISENPFPRFATVIDFWENHRKTRFALTLRDVSLMDLGGKIVPQCAVVVVSPVPPGFRYRFFSTGLVDLYRAQEPARRSHPWSRRWRRWTNAGVLPAERFRGGAGDQAPPLA
ncbi:MAG: hypothetical protein VW338_11750, partial [Rhodospirillaceae bacterium]